jgi:hypothetical protein
LKVFTYSGELSEFGLAFGEEFREDIRQFIERLRENFVLRTGLSSESGEIVERIENWWQIAYKASPKTRTTMGGISEGAGVDLSQIQFINSFLDLISYRSELVRGSLLACTTLGTIHDGSVIVAQNFDMERFYRDFAVGMDLNFGSQRLAAFTYAGVLPSVGQRTDWCVGITFLHASDVSSVGRPHASIIFDILTAETLIQAVGLPTCGPRACGAHVLLGFREGILFSYELAGTVHEVTHRFAGSAAHTNHFVSPRLKNEDLLLWNSQEESSATRRGGSLFRLARAEQLLNRMDDRRSIHRQLEEILGDTCGGPWAIYACVDTGNPLMDATTIASIFMDLGSGEFRIIEEGSPVFSSQVRV